MRASILAAAILVACARTVSAEPPSPDELLRRELVERYRAQASVHRALELKVDGEPKAHAEFYRAGLLVGARSSQAEGAFLTATDGAVLRLLVDEDVHEVSGLEDMDRASRTWSSGLGFVRAAAGREAAAVPAWRREFSFRCRSAAEDDAIRWKVGIAWQLGGNPDWLEESFWGGLSVVRRDAERSVRLAARGDHWDVSTDDGFLVGAGGVTSVEKRTWTVSSAPTRWTPGEWNVSLRKILTGPHTTYEKVDPREFVEAIHVLAAVKLCRSAPAAMPVAAQVLATCLTDRDAVRATAVGRRAEVLRRVDAEFESPVNLRPDGSRWKTRESIQRTVRRHELTPAFEAFLRRVDDVFARDEIRDEVDAPERARWRAQLKFAGSALIQGLADAAWTEK